MEEKEDVVCGITWKSRYIPKSDEPIRPITFRNMIYWRSFKDKVELFWGWLKNREGMSFNEYLDKPRELVTEWTHITILNEEKEES